VPLAGAQEFAFENGKNKRWAHEISGWYIFNVRLLTRHGCVVTDARQPRWQPVFSQEQSCRVNNEIH